MATKVIEKITEKAFELLKKNPDGIGFSELVESIFESDKKQNITTIRTVVSALSTQNSDKVYKPSRGLNRLLEFKDPETDELKKEVQPKESKIKEEDFYEPFSDWLQNDIEDVSRAITLGGNYFKDKWGTPDVIGKKVSMKSDIIEAPIEIVSAEIKTETGQLITAFGQACAYKLFSHKCYLVIPKQSSQLVLFDVKNPKTPDFTIRVRPNKHEPDYFYTNRYMSRIEKDLF